MHQIKSKKSSHPRAKNWLYRKARRRKRSDEKMQPDHPLVHLQQTIGNQAVGRLIQTQLKVGKPGDKYEQEADRVAETVMQMPDSRLQRQADEEEELRQQPAEEKNEENLQQLPEQEEPEKLQRQPEEENKEELHAQPAEKEEELKQQPEEKEENETVASKEISGHTPIVTPKIQANIQSMRGGGKPLPSSARNFFEPRFGQDFSQVRVHHDTKAAEMARDVKAKAFTVGQDVVFGKGQYDTETSKGKKLLTHELTHVVQQNAFPNFIRKTAKKGFINFQLGNTIQAKDECQLNPSTLSIEQLKTCIIQYYEQNERNTIAWKKLIKEFSNRIIKEVESLTTDEIWHKVGVETSRWMKLPKNSGAYFLQEIYLSILEKEKGNRISLAAEHPGWETERTERTFSEKKAKEFRKLPASITKARRRGPGMCLDACYHRLASLYFQKDIEAVEETKRISDILTVRKLILKLEGKYPQGVPQKIIINTLKENFQMNVETTKATLQTMAKMDRKMLKWVRGNKWITTGEFGRGLITKTMESLRSYGITAEKKEIETQNIRNEGKASDYIAEQLVASIYAWTITFNKPGNYFFALSLHDDYHCVLLRAVLLPDRKRKLYWADQKGEKDISSSKKLSDEIKDFWPDYQPTKTTIWPLKPID